MARVKRPRGLSPGYSGAILLLLSCWLPGFPLQGEQAEKPEDQGLQFENAGQNALAHGNFALAVQEFRSALKLNPDSVEAHSGLGIALRETGNLSEVLAEFQRAAKLNPKGWEPRYLLAQTFILQGEFKDAIGELQQVLRLNPEYPDAV